MTTSSIYCSKCRNNFGHQIARGTYDSDIFRQIEIISKNKNETYKCKCLTCGHIWNSSSFEAESLYKQ